MQSYNEFSTQHFAICWPQSHLTVSRHSVATVLCRAAPARNQSFLHIALLPRAAYIGHWKCTFQTARSDRIRVVVVVVMMRRRTTTTDGDDGPVMIYGDAGGDGDGLLSPAKLKSKQIQRSAESKFWMRWKYPWFEGIKHLALSQATLIRGSDWFHQICAFVGDHIVQAKAPQQQWGICKGLGHLMLCIFVHSIHPAHVDISMLSKCQMVRSKYRVQIRYITLPTSTQTTSSTNIAGSNMVKWHQTDQFDFGAQAPQRLSKALTSSQQPWLRPQLMRSA